MKKTDSQIITHIAAGVSRLRQSDEKSARKHVRTARKIAMRVTQRLPRSIRSQFCDSCDMPLIIGTNAFVRVRGKRTILHCKACGHMQKFGPGKKIQ